MREIDWAWYGTLALILLQWGLIPHLLAQRTKSPNATLAWLWAILLFPGIGGILYLLMGSEKVRRQRLAAVAAVPHPPAAAELPPDKILALPELSAINGRPATAGNAADILPDGTSFFPVLLDAIASARHHIHIEFYIWRPDRAGLMVLDALTQAAQRGVAVRVLVDEIGSLWTSRRFFASLEAAGGRFSWFRTFAPLSGRFHLNLRNHRKLVITDGTTALTGGMNIGNEYWGGNHPDPPHRDAAVRLRGPTVLQLAEVFAEDWLFSTGESLTDPAFQPSPLSCGTVGVQVVPGSPDNDLNEIQLTTLAILQQARTRVWMMTPYFVPEPPLVAALQLAAMRGVDVRIMVPEKGNHAYLTHVTRSYFEDLLPHGVRIFRYHPRLLHAKVLTVDGQCAMLGSANLDIRSLRINFELNVLLSSPQAAATAEHLFLGNADNASEVTLTDHLNRSHWLRIAEAVFRPLAPLL
jgi:cardiolipin synthase